MQNVTNYMNNCVINYALRDANNQRSNKCPAYNKTASDGEVEFRRTGKCGVPRYRRYSLVHTDPEC